jgi:hypothetical protein
MIKVIFYQDSEKHYLGFQTKGHADYAEAGSDIICAGVSALVINTVNSIELLTNNSLRVKTDQETGYMAVRLGEAITPEAQLLIQSLCCGLESMEEEHRQYIHVGFKEV